MSLRSLSRAAGRFGHSVTAGKRSGALARHVLASGNPVFVARLDGHMALANSVTIFNGRMIYER